MEKREKIEQAAYHLRRLLFPLETGRVRLAATDRKAKASPKTWKDLREIGSFYRNLKILSQIFAFPYGTHRRYQGK
ncbi:MAG: hypothetical protein HY231_20800 [Acidobacteria bacterium]|nr:hypothetical protein [Acidobacteriota bacterium]